MLCSMDPSHFLHARRYKEKFLCILLSQGAERTDTTVTVKIFMMGEQRLPTTFANQSRRIAPTMVGFYIAVFFISTLTKLTSCSETDLSEVNNSLHEESEKRSRFISFDNEHGEVKVELDFAVPFLKIPMESRRSGSHGNIHEPLLEVNSKGLVTVATMMFLFVTIIPKIVKLFIPQAHASTTDGLVPLMSRIDEALHHMNIPSTECYQRSACWIGSSTFINPSHIANVSGPDWLKAVANRPDVMEALRKGKTGGDCSVYKCSLPMQAITKLVSLGRSMFGTEN